MQTNRIKEHITAGYLLIKSNMCPIRTKKKFTAIYSLEIE